MAATTPRQIQRTYLGLLLGNTLAASLIWGINTIFLLDAGLSNLEAFAANAFFTVGMVVFEVPTGVVADTVYRRDLRRDFEPTVFLPLGPMDGPPRETLTLAARSRAGDAAAPGHANLAAWPPPNRVRPPRRDAPGGGHVDVLEVHVGHASRIDVAWPAVVSALDQATIVAAAELAGVARCLDFHRHRRLRRARPERRPRQRASERGRPPKHGPPARAAPALGARARRPPEARARPPR